MNSKNDLNLHSIMTFATAYVLADKSVASCQQFYCKLFVQTCYP